jgi:hypothetical protein
LITYAQNVGIGTTAPTAKLHVENGAVLFTGPETIDPNTTVDPPISNAGARMMWYPQKAAFRAGAVVWDSWNGNNIGFYSFAGGWNTMANGESSTSFGVSTIASGYGSTSMGNGSIASGITSTSMGWGTLSSGWMATAMGSSSTASGYIATSMGWGTLASGAYATAMGRSTNASGSWSLATGGGNYAKALGTFSAGMYNDTSDAPNPAAGAPTDRLFQIGNGAANDARSNALTVLRNSKTGIGTIDPDNQLEVIGLANGTPVTLTIGNRSGFGPAALEFVSDYGLLNEWRPGYIRSNDGGVGGFIGSLEFYTNGAGSANKYGNVKGFEVRDGVANTASGTVGAYSDARLKNNITAFTDGLNVISKINPVQFYYNADAPFNTDRQQVGIIAQELEKIAPYMVEKNKQNGYDDLRSVNNQAYTFLLINAVKEQQQQIENQQKQIDDLKKLVEQLLKK